MKAIVKMQSPATAGMRLRRIRESLGYSLRDVEAASGQIAETHDSPRFFVPFSRLRHIETSNTVPSIHRLYSLSLIYRVDRSSIIEWYGVDWNSLRIHLSAGIPPLTHRIDVSQPSQITPLKGGPETTVLEAQDICAGCDVIRTCFTAEEKRSIFFACVGMEDYTMYPLLMPGTLLKVDARYSRIKTSHWKSEYERPIYFIETRNGYRVGWCSQNGTQLTVYSHPLSPAQPVTYVFPREAEVLGQVSEISMPLRSMLSEQCEESVG